MAKEGDTRECPECHRWIRLRLMGGRTLVWGSHKPARGKRKNCPTSGDPYKGT